MQVRGVRPFFSEKYDITRHSRYKYLSDADKKNTFDVDSYLSSLRRKRRRVISTARLTPSSTPRALKSGRRGTTSTTSAASIPTFCKTSL